jgi:response regulator RpfG family c-di-GMP phosphodiesterase
MSGIDVCKTIKGDEKLQDVFVILVSGVQVSSECQTNGLNVGADGYILKSLPSREFMARIHSVVRIKKAEDALRKKEEEQQVLIAKLQEALAEIKTLTGFIPICTSCKKIRDDEGYWNQVEEYISRHTQAMFTHGICPQCAETYLAELAELEHMPPDAK